MFPKDDQRETVYVKDNYMTEEMDETARINTFNNDNNEQSKSKVKGLTLWMTSILIAGELVGGGILTLPVAMDQSGILGFFMVVIFGCAACYAGMRLGTCWEILMERWPEYQEHSRDPYPSIADRAFGKWVRRITRIFVDITLFGGATVFILIGSKLSQSLSGFDTLSYCYWVLIFGACLTPLMWLGTPKDFWPVGLGALGATVITVIMAISWMIYAHVKYDKDVEITHSPVDTKSVSLAFGTILFMYGGASTFPSIQNDMIDKRKFSKAVSIGSLIIIMIYLPTALVSYFTLGSTAKPILLASIKSDIIRKITEILIIIHLLLAFFIVINPFCQDIEKLLKIPNKFGIKRVLARGFVMCCILFVAETVPHFDYILNVIGGSTITLLTFIFPCMFYLKLTSMKNEEGKEWPKRTVPLYEKILLVEIIMVGIVGGCLSTYHAVERLTSPNSFVAPCYVNIYATKNI